MPLFFNEQFNSLEDLFLQQLGDLYDTEQRIIEALPLMADAASNPVLKNAFRDHTAQSQRQLKRLEDIFHEMGREPESRTSESAKGLIEDGSTMCDAEGDADVKDAALIAAAQRVEHYEIAGYGTARTFAQHLGRPRAADLLQQTLNEEGETDKKLTQIAESSVNVKAEHAQAG